MQPRPSGPLADGPGRWGDIKWLSWDLAFRERPVSLERVQDGWCNRVAGPVPLPLQALSFFSAIRCKGHFFSACLCFYAGLPPSHVSPAVFVCATAAAVAGAVVFLTCPFGLSHVTSQERLEGIFFQVCWNHYLEHKKELDRLWWWRWLWPHVCLQLSHKISLDFWPLRSHKDSHPNYVRNGDQDKLKDAKTSVLFYSITWEDKGRLWWQYVTIGAHDPKMCWLYRSPVVLLSVRTLMTKRKKKATYLSFSSSKRSPFVQQGICLIWSRPFSFFFGKFGTFLEKCSCDTFRFYRNETKETRGKF